MRKTTLLFLLLAFFVVEGTGQIALSLRPTVNYRFSPSALPEWINGYDPAPQNLATMRELLDKLKLEANFSLLANTSVDVMAVMVDGERLLLYHPRLMKRVEEKDPEAIGLLLQQATHHIMEHPFLADGREQEYVLASDRLTGFFLARLIIPWQEARAFLYAEPPITSPPLFYPDLSVRVPTMSEGYGEGRTIVENKKGVFGLTTPKDEEYSKLSFHDAAATPPSASALIPAFPFPPPRSSASHNLPNGLLDFPGFMSDIDRSISRAISACGYVEKSYYGVPGGFALVTRIEQIDPRSGQSLLPPDRWSADIRWSGQFSIKEYLQALFFGRRGHYRVFVFLVTDQPFYQRDKQVPKSEAEQWLRQGYNRLPPELAERIYSKDHSCTVLVYEFETDESGESRLLELSGLSSHTHLERAGILAQMK